MAIVEVMVGSGRERAGGGRHCRRSRATGWRWPRARIDSRSPGGPRVDADATHRSRLPSLPAASPWIPAPSITIASTRPRSTARRATRRPSAGSSSRAPRAPVPTCCAGSSSAPASACRPSTCARRRCGCSRGAGRCRPGDEALPRRGRAPPHRGQRRVRGEAAAAARPRAPRGARPLARARRPRRRPDARRPARAGRVLARVARHRLLVVRRDARAAHAGRRHRRRRVRAQARGAARARESLDRGDLREPRAADAHPGVRDAGPRPAGRDRGDRRPARPRVRRLARAAPGAATRRPAGRGRGGARTLARRTSRRAARRCRGDARCVRARAIPERRAGRSSRRSTRRGPAIAPAILRRGRRADASASHRTPWRPSGTTLASPRRMTVRPLRETDPRLVRVFDALRLRRVDGARAEAAALLEDARSEGEPGIAAWAELALARADHLDAAFDASIARALGLRDRARGGGDAWLGVEASLAAASGLVRIGDTRSALALLENTLGARERAGGQAAARDAPPRARARADRRRRSGLRRRRARARVPPRARERRSPGDLRLRERARRRDPRVGPARAGGGARGGAFGRGGDVPHRARRGRDAGRRRHARDGRSRASAR